MVHEAYVRLVDVERALHWNSSGHFFAAAAEAMRRMPHWRHLRGRAVFAGREVTSKVRLFSSKRYAEQPSGRW